MGSILGVTHRLLGSSFLWVIFRILEGNPKKELPWSPWLRKLKVFGFRGGFHYQGLHRV